MIGKRLNQVYGWLKRTCPFLFEEKMPVWLTLVASLAAAWGAYVFSPAINRQFQVDATRTAHLSKTTENLNTEIIVLSQKVRRLNEALVNETPNVPTLREDCLDLVTKLQWMLVDLRVVLTSEEDVAAVSRLADAITEVQSALNRSVDARAQPELLAAMRSLGDETHDVLDRLYVKASLKEASASR